MRVPHHSSLATQKYLEDYYIQQLGGGGGYPIFVGGRSQKGRGLGSLFSSLFRNVIPLLKRGLSAFGKHAIRTGLEVAGDVIKGGQSVRESAMHRIPEGIKNFAMEQKFIPSEDVRQEGSGVRRLKRKRNHGNKKKRKTKTSSKKRKKSHDIFS